MEKIMIIDSDVQQIRELNDGLGGTYRILGCSRGSKAMELFHIFDPEALILDPSTRDLNGKDFIRQVRSLPKGRRIPILALSRMTTLKTIEESFDLGVDIVFSKPCAAERVKVKLQKYLAEPSKRFPLELVEV